MREEEKGKGARAALLWSGGKDAALALEVLRQGGGCHVAALVTTALAPEGTVQAHGVPLVLIEAQARALGLPLHVVHVPAGATNDAYEAHVAEALAPLGAQGVTAVAAGDLLLEDVRAYREALIRRCGFDALFPLWQQSTEALARRFIRRGYRALVCSVDTEQLDAFFAGRPYDAALLRDLPAGVDPCGENGEFHTFVTGGPPFARPVPVRAAGTCGAGRMRYAVLRAAKDAT